MKITISEKIGEVSAILKQPEGAKAILVLSHGAGAGMTHDFMEQLAQRLFEQDIATLRFQFPYMEKGSKRPDSPKVAHPTILAAIEQAKTLANGLPIYVGGKSFGGRMSSQIAAIHSMDGVKGLVFFGFPLHSFSKIGIERAAHLNDVKIPMLFLQGTRDKLAKLDLIQEVCGGLELATLNIFEGADHSFKMLKRSGKTQEEVIVELAKVVKDWIVSNE